MSKTLLKVISLILTVAMIFTMNISGIQTAFAEEGDQVDTVETDTTETGTEGTETTESVPDYQAIALESLLDENGYLTDEGLLSLQYIPCDEEKYTELSENSDGTSSLILYTEPIKYETDEGEYDYIDPSLTDVSPQDGTEELYETVASDVEVQMSDNLNQSDAIQIAYKDYNIAFKPVDVLALNGESSADLSFVEAETDIVAESIDEVEYCESIIYSDTFSENTDIVITPTSNGAKEEIVLNDIPVETEFSYELTVSGIVPLLRADGNLYFADLNKGLLVAAIPAPFMYDSKVEYSESYDIQVELEKIDSDTYIYTLVPDREFLESTSTLYPVVIDPTINTLERGAVEDTFITKRYSSNNYCNDANLKVGYSDDLNVSRGLVRITAFPAVLAGNRIDSVIYHAYQNYSGSSSPTMDLAYITSNWNVTTAKWSNMPGTGSVIAGQTVNIVDDYEWTITDAVKGWYANPSTNFGMYIKIHNETINQYKRFYSVDSSTNKSYFIFNFTDLSAPYSPTDIHLSANSFNNETGLGDMTISWSPVVDRPIDNVSGKNYGSGINHYEVAICCDGIWQEPPYINVPATRTYYTFEDYPDNSTYSFKVRAVDNNYSIGSPASDWSTTSFVAPDRTGPKAPTLFKVTPEVWTADNPTITWEGITDEGNHLDHAEYQVDGGNWIPIGKEFGVASGSKTIDASSWADGQHKIRLRGVDSASPVNNGTPTPDVYNYFKDTTAPSINMSVSNDELVGIVNISATITNESGSSFSNWVLDYGLGNPASSYSPDNLLASGTSPVAGSVIYEWDTTELVENEHYTIRLRAYDTALRPGFRDGNFSTITIVLLKTSDSQVVIAGLQIDQPGGYNPDGYQPDVGDTDQYVIDSQNTDVEYQKIGNAGVAGLSGGMLYANNELHDTEAVAGDGFTFDATAYDGGWVYPEGRVVFLYAQANDAIAGELYSTVTYEALQLTDTFENANKIENLDNVEIYDNKLVWLVKTDGQFASSGSFESNIKDFAGDISYIDLTVDHMVPDGATIKYEVSIDGGLNWQEISPVSTDGGVTVNLGNRKYFTTNPTGDSVKIRAELTRSTTNESPSIKSWSIDVRYTTYANAVLVDNIFPKNARGMTNLIGTYHDETSESIKLKLVPPLYSSYLVRGSVESTVRVTSNDVIEACLEVTENLDEGTGITYYISTQGGADGTWEEITPGNASNLEDWVELSDPGTQVVIKAELTGDGTATPELLDWRLCIKEKIAGQPYMVKLVDEPWNLSTMTGANYMTLLRWEESDTANVTYNVYRSTTPYFVPSTETLAAEGLTENSWNDYNLNYGQTFYYKVTAVMMINGHVRESLPSNEAWATVVSENEVQKRLGLQNYWTYSGFGTGSGTGYVNVSNGDVVYSTTDIIVSDPFLAAVMRRTFNSMADTKTAMGYGWDFSFNTCLMREYLGSDEVGMILKDGDGSLHQFAKNGEVYDSAPGTYMKLTYDSVLDEYQIVRKDNIVYHFDGQSMKLKGFTDNNGNALTFTYDSRGNLSEVENTVGDTITLTYYVEGAAPSDPDYTYVNYHPDMLESVTWTENDTDPVSITYHYEYNQSDRLTRAYTVIENNTVYEETFIYNEANQLVTISDPENKETDIAYDAEERVQSITAANGDTAAYAYSDLGENQNKTTVTNQYGVGSQYLWDDKGLLYEKKDALGNSIYYTHGNNPTDNMYLVTGMSYYNRVGASSTPQLISYSYAYTNGNITSITGPDGTVTTYGAYNSFNKPSSVTISKGAESATTYYGYDSHGNQTTVTDPEGKVTTNTYGTVNGDPGYLIQVEGDFGNQTGYTYDSRGRATQIKEYNNGTPVRTATTYGYEYNVDGYFIRVIATDAEGNSVTAYYDRLGRIVKKEYPDNADDAANPDVYERWSYDMVGNLTWSRAANGEEISYTYDDLYRLTDTAYPDGSATSIDYLKWDSDGNAGTGDTSGRDADKIIQTDGTGVQSISYYDVAGRLVKTSVSDGTNETITARYEYDLLGNCTRVTDNAGRVSEAQYNIIGQTTKTIVDPAGENIQTTYAYDLFGNKASVTDGEGYTTTYSYDLDSRLENVRQTVNGSTLTTSYAYDIQEGGVIKNRVTDAAGHVSETWFDPMGRKLVDYNDGVTGDGTAIQTGYTYNDDYQVEIVTRNDGTKEKYTYNASGTVHRVDYYEAAESTESPSDDYILYVYNNSGQVTLESVYHGATEETTTYAYDEMGRVRQTTQGDLSSGGLSVNYVYDNAGKVIEINYTKDNALRKLGYEYDSYGRIHYITLALGTAPADTVREYVYKANGDIDYIKDFRNFEEDGADYIQTAYEINSAGMTTQITYTDFEGGTGAGVKKEEYTMAYDNRGFIVSETAYTNYGTAQTVNKSYIYDAIGRLTQATIGDETKNYTYDNVGNRLTMGNGTDSYAYSYDATGFNRMTGTTKNGAFETSYTYDARGNQTQEVQHYFDITIGQDKTSYNQTTDYTYDLMNNMVEADVSTPEADAQGDVTYNHVTSTNSYNAQGIRVERVEDGKTTQYYYTGSATLYTTNENGWLLTENILDPSGQTIASARFDDGNAYTEDPYADSFFFYHYDKRGSTTAIVQPDGNLVKGYTYDEFGNLEQSGEEDFLNDVTFTGSVSDTSTGLQYMNSRYYNPETGRFLSQDTYSGNAYEPWTQHLYSYCGNNPTNFIDPTGHMRIEGGQPGDYEGKSRVISEPADVGGSGSGGHTGSGNGGSGSNSIAQNYDPYDGICEDYYEDMCVDSPFIVMLFGSVLEGNTGIIYLRTDLDTGAKYVGRTNNIVRYMLRQQEHARANPGSRYEFEILRRQVPISGIRQAEQEEIDNGGGPTNKSHPDGGLENRRNEIRKNFNETMIVEPTKAFGAIMGVYGYWPIDSLEQYGTGMSDSGFVVIPGTGTNIPNFNYGATFDFVWGF